MPIQEIQLKLSSVAKWQTFCLGLNVLTNLLGLYQWSGGYEKLLLFKDALMFSPGA